MMSHFSHHLLLKYTTWRIYCVKLNFVLNTFFTFSTLNINWKSQYSSSGHLKGNQRQGVFVFVWKESSLDVSAGDIFSWWHSEKIDDQDRNGSWKKDECMRFTSSSDRPPGNLECHLRIHSGERPFCCSQCHHTFGQKAELHRHMLSHSGSGGGFLCSYCGKSLRDPHSLKSHERLHTGERPHRCSVCGKGQEGKGTS